MIAWCRTVLGALELVLFSMTPASAQGAAKPEQPSGTGLLLWILLLCPALIIIALYFPATRRIKRNMRQIDRSVEMAEESLLLSRERVALQKETNRLLGKLIEAVGRD